MQSVPPRLRILQVLGNAIVGGMETYVERLVSHLLTADLDVVCVCPFESPLTTRWRAQGVKVSILRMPDDPAWASLQCLTTLIRQERIGIVHCHLANAHVLGAIAARLTGTPILATVHGRNVSALDLEVQRVAGTSLAVVCEAAYLHALGLGVPRDRLHWVPNGVDAQAFAAATPSPYLHERLGLDPATPLAGFIGRLSPEKGPEVFVRAAGVAHAAGCGAHFVVVGDGPMKPLLERMAAEAGLGGVVHFIGAQQRMADVLSALACVVSTSHSEGMPLALMEAMAAGRAIVATAVGGTVELVEQGETGYLVAPADYEAVAKQIMLLVEDKDLRLQLGRAARRRAIERFPFDKSAGAMTTLLCSLARERPAARVGTRISE